jgi:hypothetical protein
VLRHAAQRTDTEADQRTQLHAQSVEVAEAIAVAQDCTPLVDECTMTTKHKIDWWFGGL